MKTIYFTTGPIPTPEELEAASEISGEVVIRNAEYVGQTDAIENCDAVAGDVPQLYIDYFKKPAGYFVDAPEDGETYGRKDAAWSEVSGGGGGGGGDLKPNAPPLYRRSYLVALPPDTTEDGNCEWAPDQERPVFSAAANAAPYELSNTPFRFIQTGFDSKEIGRTTYSFFVEVLTPGALILNRKVFVASSEATDKPTDQFRYSYSLKVFTEGEDTPTRFVTFNRLFYTNAAISAFLAGVPDPSDFNANVIDIETIKILNLNAGRHLLEIELNAYNASSYYGALGFEASLIGGGTGGIIEAGLYDFFTRNMELNPPPLTPGEA